MNLNDYRKKQFNELAQFILESNSTKRTDLIELCNREEIKLHIDDYENAFDGAIVFEDSEYHIHLNSTLGNHFDSVKHRFTLAHELGHYHIPEHHENLKAGSWHFSDFSLDNENLIELEADYFASCLLFPKEKFKKECGGKRFNIELIQNLSITFETSKISTLKKFCEFGTHEILMVYFQNGKVKWYDRSKDFPFLKFKFQNGSPPPKYSLLSDYFTNPNEYNHKIRELESGDWFYTKNEKKIYEQCLFSEVYNYAISVIWYD